MSCVVPCEGCRYTQAPRVGNRGPEDSAVVVLGERPGIQEVKKKTPFIGPSGELLEKCWPEHLNFTLDDCYIVNAMQCFGKSSKDEESRVAASVDACRARVFEELAKSPRRVVIALGKWANYSLCGDADFKITQRRGEFYTTHDSIRGINYTVLPALHPAALLRGQGSVPHFRQDLIRAMEFATESEIPEAAWVDPKFSYMADAAAVKALTRHIRALAKINNRPVVLTSDLETSGFRWHKDYVLCAGFYIDKASGSSDVGWVVDWNRIRMEAAAVGLTGRAAEVAKGSLHYTNLDSEFVGLQKADEENRPLFMAVKELFELPPDVATYNWQNGKFDIKWLNIRGIYTRVDDDTYLLDVTLDERPGGHDLDNIAKNRLGAPNHKHVVEQWVPKKTDSYARIPRRPLWEYLARDLKKTALILPSLGDEVHEDKDCSKLYTRTLLPASGLLSRIEMRGIHIDNDVRMLKSKDVNGVEFDHEGTFVTLNQLEYNRDIEVLQDKVSELAGYYVNPNSPIQVAELLYDRLGLKLRGKKPTDTRKETLDKLPGHPVVKAIREYRRVAKVLGTYINPIEKHIAFDGRIHSTYNLGGARTGRLASSEPNLQNLPREARVRRMYCAPKGRELTEGDYNTAELRMLACLSRDVFLTGVFLDDKRNLHDEVSVAMYGADFTADQRIRAKAINFGIPYGREAFSIAMEFDITSNEAQRLIDAWLARAPEAAEFLERCRQAPSRRQTLTSIFGRKCRPGVVSMEVLKAMENEFRNFFMQSTISDFDLHAAMEMEYELERLDSFIVNPVHDSLLVENPPSARKEVALVMRKYMQGVPKKWIITPIEFSVDFKFGQWWGMCEKDKQVNSYLQARNLNGQLIV